MKDNVHEVDFLRIFATASLLVWHCFYCPIGRWALLEEDSLIHFLMKTSSYLIPDANMPLFTFISGFLFYFLFKEKGKYRDFLPFVTGKVKRLLVPFLFFGLLLPLSSIGYPDVLVFVRDKMLVGEGGHLWYCPMLFWCFIFAFVLLKINNKWLVAVFCALSLFLCCSYEFVWSLPFKLPLGIGNACYYFVYFFAGGVVCNYRQALSQKLVPKRWLLLAAYVLVALVFRYFKPVLPFQAVLYALVLWVFVLYFSEKGKLAYSSRVASLSKMCFGVYIFHHWLAWNFTHFSGLQPLFQQHYILFTVVLLFVVGGLSVLFTWLALKTRVGRLLLA